MKYGLINKVVAADKLDEQINEYIDKVGKLSGEVLSLGKKILNKQSTLDLENAYCVASEGMKENIL